MSVYHIWPCDTWCGEEDLGEYLSFMSDDYITVIVVNEPEDYEVPSYNEVVENGLVYGGFAEEGKMSYIKLIKSAHDHELALMRLMSLMDLNPQSGSSESDEMDVLALLIEKYEEDHFPISNPDPIEAIKFRMEQQGLKNRDLIPFIGTAPKVSEILNGTRNLNLNMIRKLSSGLGISSDVLNKIAEDGK